MSATIIVATDRNWLIGDRPDGQLIGRTPWQGQLPADMEYFMDQTMGKVVAMTRPTYLTIPKKFRPLRGRTNVVLTTRHDFTEDGCVVVNSTEQLFREFGAKELMIAGGGMLYEQSLRYVEVDRVLRTKVDAEFEGNIYFPELLVTEWELIRSVPFQADKLNSYDYVFETYVRIQI